MTIKRKDQNFKAKIIFFLSLFIIGSYATASVTKPVEIKEEFLKEVKNDKNKYNNIAPTPSSPIFLWDFTSNKNIHRYAYNQISFSQSKMGHKSDWTEYNMTSVATMLISSQGDGTGDFLLKDINASFTIKMNKDTEPQTRKRADRPIVMQGIKEDGTTPLGDTAQELLVKMLFIVPQKNLAIKEYVDIPETTLFSAMGSLLEVTGHHRVTLTRYVTINKKTYAQFDVDTDVSNIRIPKELKKWEYSHPIKGKSVFYFDILNRSLLSGTIAMHMQVGVSTAMSNDINKTNIDKNQMLMITDVLIKFNSEN